MLAIIGTAGRDKSKPVTRDLWNAMVRDAQMRVPRGAPLVSGGAAGADHVAVALFLIGHTASLRLHLPGVFQTCTSFDGGYGTAAGAANYYHGLFSNVIGMSSMTMLVRAIERGAEYTTQPKGPGMGAFMARNALVASDATAGCLAYTWGTGDTPADGGTRHTWDRIKGQRVHVPLGGLVCTK